MKKLLGLFLGATLIPATGFALSATLGQQDFSNGQAVTLSQVLAASAGEAAPFDDFYGSDPYGPNFNKSFTFTYAPESLTWATLTFGLIDGDGDEVGTQLSSFSLDGMDLTALMTPLIEATHHATADIVVLALPSSALALLSDGSATFNLALKGPSKIGELPYNGAGLDFANLSGAGGNPSVPDAGFSASLFALAMGAITLLRRKIS